MGHDDLAATDSAEEIAWFGGRWFPERAFVYSVLALALLLRMLKAATTFLNPDEAYHYFVANQPSVWLAYQAGLTSAHPPFMFVLLYLWRALGSSELALRVPFVISSTLSCWVAFQWIGRICSRQTALLALLLLAFFPPLVMLGSEIRQYSFLLLFMACALYFFERAIQEGSIAMTALFSLALCAALLTHYSSLLLVLALGLYAPVRYLYVRQPLRVVLTWALCQIAILGLSSFFYFTQIRKLETHGAASGMAGGYLHEDLFHAGREAELVFISRQTFAFFHYLAGQPIIGALLLLCFAAGTASLFRRKVFPAGNLEKSHIAWLLLISFAVTWSAAVLGKYPFGGTRHSIFLAPFAVLGACIAGTGYNWRRAPWSPILVAVLAIAVCYLLPAPRDSHFAPGNQDRRLMREAVKFLRDSAPQGSVVLVDMQSRLPFLYYFCPETTVAFTQRTATPLKSGCGGYAAFTSAPDEWMLSARDEGLRQITGYSNSAPVSVFLTGWNVDKVGEVRLRLQALSSHCGSFGQNILVCSSVKPEPQPNSVLVAP